MKNTTRNVLNVPMNMEQVKREFVKVRNMFFARNKTVDKKAVGVWENDTYKIEKETYALFWLMMQNFNSYIAEQECDITNKMLELMGDENEIKLYEYGVKIHLDDEIKYFTVEELTKKDWKEYDEKCNKEFLNK